MILTAKRKRSFKEKTNIKFGVSKDNYLGDFWFMFSITAMERKGWGKYLYMRFDSNFNIVTLTFFLILLFF